MTIQVDWAGTGSTPGGVPYEIYVPKVDLTLVQAGPPQIYELDVDVFRITLRDLEDDPDGRPWPKTHNHDTQTVLGGVTYARKVQILAPYSVTFEDGQYRVLLAGANNNILDVSNVNQVSIAPQNSAGLIVVENGGTGEADWTTGEKAQIRDALGVDGVKVTATGGQLQTVAQGVELLRKLGVNRLELEDGDTGNYVLYDDDDVTPLLTFSMRDKFGDPVYLPTRAPARRSHGT